MAKLKERIAEVEEVIGNLKNSLSANPGIASVLEPKLKASEAEKTALYSELASFVGDDARVAELREQIEKAEGSLEKLEIQAKEYADLNNLQVARASTKARLALLQADFDSTKLLEADDRLRLVYSGAQFGELNGTLVQSLPNEMPLVRDRRFYTLGMETLLAYYGLDDKHVHVSEDMKNLQVIGRDGVKLIDAPLKDGQFVEVNWFSKWTEPVPEKVNLKKALDFFNEQSFDEYVELVPQILRAALSRVKGLQLPENDSDLPSVLPQLKQKVNEGNVVAANQFMQALAGEIPVKKAPDYEKLHDLYHAISLNFMPPELTAAYNPMCSIYEVHYLDNALFRAEEMLRELRAKSKVIETRLISIRKLLKNLPENHPKAAEFREAIRKGEVIDKQNLAKESIVLEKINDLKATDLFDQFENAIVFVGPEEKTLQDLAPTPFDVKPVPKVSVHGNIVKTLTSGLYLKRFPLWVDHAATLAFCLLLAYFAVYSGAHSHLVQGLSVVLQLIYVVVTFYVFAQSHYVLPVAVPSLAGLSTTFLGVVVTLVLEQKAKGRLKGMFGSYVSQDLVDQMIDSGEEPSLGGEETKITAYFSDVQAFSSFSELLSPTGLVDLMNEYLTAMTNILQEERGTLDKYIGDAIVAMYGAPIPMDDHAYQSVRTALLMQVRQSELREKWASEGDKWPDIVRKMQTRIGCNTGTATVGNMGALDRFNYTMMGDMVNLAARCESGAKAYGAYIMITEETKDASIATKDDIAYRYLDKIVVKGRTQPVAMYEPTGFMADLGQETQDCLDCFQQGIDKYLLQDWDGAMEMFEKAKELEPNKPGITPGVKDNPSMMLIERCMAMKWNPPGDDWDGVFVMTSK